MSPWRTAGSPPQADTGTWASTQTSTLGLPVWAEIHRGHSRRVTGEGRGPHSLQTSGDGADPAELSSCRSRRPSRGDLWPTRPEAEPCRPSPSLQSTLHSPGAGREGL